MKTITIIHNTYKYNPQIQDSIRNNLSALKALKVDYQYIVFNDKGDKNIKELISEFRDDIEYIYSDVNYGGGNSSGGWIGAIPKIKGRYVHNIGQDDFFSILFYKNAIGLLDASKADIGAVLINGYNSDSQFNTNGCPYQINNSAVILGAEYMFNAIFNINKTTFTTCNNFAYAPGVVYKASLHDIIGIPNTKEFNGSCDFEYWVRILFHGYSFILDYFPSWFYIKSKYSTSTLLGGEDRKNVYNPRIKEKYLKLWKENGCKIKTVKV